MNDPFQRLDSRSAFGSLEAAFILEHDPGFADQVILFYVPYG